MNEWFRSPAAWIGIGLAGQLLFGARFIVQWLVSERSGRVTIPVTFWHLSLVGGVILFVYAIHRRDPVFALGQGAGLVIYARNLMLDRTTPGAAARSEPR